MHVPRRSSKKKTLRSISLSSSKTGSIRAIAHICSKARTKKPFGLVPQLRELLNANSCSEMRRQREVFNPLRSTKELSYLITSKTQGTESQQALNKVFTSSQLRYLGCWQLTTGSLLHSRSTTSKESQSQHLSTSMTFFLAERLFKFRMLKCSWTASTKWMKGIEFFSERTKLFWVKPKGQIGEGWELNS